MMIRVMFGGREMNYTLKSACLGIPVHPAQYEPSAGSDHQKTLQSPSLVIGEVVSVIDGIHTEGIT